jgi:RND family efflux transporter MFP subunit
MNPKELPPAEERPLLDKPREERLLEEIQSLKQQLEHERNGKKDSEKKSHKWLNARVIAIVALIVIVLAFLLGFLPYYFRRQELKKEAAERQQMLPILTYIEAKRSPRNADLHLPGNIEAVTEAPILARADGYLGKRYVDIGDRVHAGQLLAVIEAPDLDQQVRQGQAQLMQLKAAVKQASANLQQGQVNRGLAEVTAKRWAGLVVRGAVSKQENDQQQAAYQAQIANVGALTQALSASEENVAAGEANLRRLLELQSFERVRAPFDGIVTLRNVDTGALIGTGNTLLFRVAQIDRLRTYIYVPETVAPDVQVGQTASLTVAEYTGRRYQGRIARTSSSLDPATRTLVTDVSVPNPDRTLLPGMFAEVSLNVSRPNPPVLIPGDALLVRSDGTFVAVLGNEERPQNAKDQDGQASGQAQQNGQQAKSGQQGKKEDPKKELKQEEERQKELPTFTVHLIRVNVGRDYGDDLEILGGLKGGERVVINLNDSVQENVKVKGAKSNTPPGSATQGSGAAKTSLNTEKMAPQPNGETVPQKPDKERTNRGPAH